jgi:hypothetical protein
VKERGGMAAILSHQSRKGVWTVPRHFRVACVLGNAELDLREARLASGVTEIEVFALFASVEILVPPGIRVETEGGGIAGAFSFEPDSTVEVPLDGPVIVLKGDAYFSHVEAIARFAHESHRDARKRRRLTGARGGRR